MPERTPHILNASSNLLGFCFLVLISIKALNVVDVSLVDKVVDVSILFFAVSAYLSFMSMRSQSPRSDRYEQLADYVFIGGLASILTIAVLLLLNKF